MCNRLLREEISHNGLLQDNEVDRDTHSKMEDTTTVEDANCSRTNSSLRLELEHLEETMMMMELIRIATGTAAIKTGMCETPHAVERRA